MGRKSDVSFEEKTQLICLAQEGVNTNNIAERLGHHLDAVRKHIAAFKKLPLTTLPCSSRRGLALRRI
jgi:hypothetical protein